MLWERRWQQWLVEWAARWDSVTSPAPLRNSKRPLGFGCGRGEEETQGELTRRATPSELMPSFLVRTSVGFCRPVCGHKSSPGALATSCECDACRCAGSWAQSSGRSWTACQPSARVPAVQLTIPLQSHSPAYWSYHSSTTRVLICWLSAPLRIRSYTPGLGRGVPRQCVMPKSFPALKMSS